MKENKAYTIVASVLIIKRYETKKPKRVTKIIGEET